MKHIQRYNKKENVPELGLLQRYDNDSLDALLDRLDFSRLPWKVKVSGAWPMMGPDRNKLFIYVRMRARDVTNRRKWTWIGPAYRLPVPWPRGAKYIKESVILARVQNDLIDIVTHELDENVSWFGRRIFDTHTRRGRNITGRR